MQIQSLLEKAGLDRHEVAVYLSLIQMKEGTAGQVAKKSGVPRTYSYRILDDLIEKGFVQANEQRSIRRYCVTDFEAPQRYIEKQQLELYRIHQEAHSLTAQLENLANPQVSAPHTELLKDQPGVDDLWRLLHSTITREIWVINPPQWWGDPTLKNEVKVWENYRKKQHIWEKRFTTADYEVPDLQFTESKQLRSQPNAGSTIFLIDQYQVQVSNWEPFRAIRVENSEMVELLKAMLE